MMKRPHLELGGGERDGIVSNFLLNKRTDLFICTFIGS